MLLLPLQCGMHRHVPLAPGLLQTTKPCFYQSPCPVQDSFSIQSSEACEQLLSAQDVSPHGILNPSNVFCEREEAGTQSKLKVTRPGVSSARVTMTALK